MATDRTQIRREEILEAAIGQVIARGIGSVRIADVARARGISTGLVHYHFETKDQLLAEAFSFEADRDLAELDVILHLSMPVEERLARSLDLYGPQGDARGWRIWLDGWSESLRNEQLRSVIGRLNEAWTTTIEALIAEGVAAKVFAVKDARGSAVRILSLIDGMSVRAVLWPDAPRSDGSYAWLDAVIDAELRPRG